MATRLRRGRASGSPTRSQYNRASRTDRREYRSLLRMSGQSNARSSGS